MINLDWEVQLIARTDIDSYKFNHALDHNAVLCANVEIHEVIPMN